MKLIIKVIIILFSWFFFASILNATVIKNQELQELNQLIGNNDSVIVADPDGKIIFSKNPDKQLIPASTLKILTSLWALNYLGIDFRYKTEIYFDQTNDLFVKGFGDPLLISEVIKKLVQNICIAISNKKIFKNKQLNRNIILDSSYFDPHITVPGTTNISNQPYDAPLGALCANFNTVFFIKNKNNEYLSAEQQTPLLPFIKKRIKSSQVNNGRIMLTQEESVLYLGYLMKYYIKKQGCNIVGNGRIISGKISLKTCKLLFTYVSPFSLKELLSKLLKYSNNYIANQLLITMGIKKYGPPGTIKKGVLGLQDFAKNKLKIDNIQISEGAGISRKNRLSAKMMLKILEQFKPYFTLLKKKGNEYYKTGTLTGIRTKAGYILNQKKELYSFVVMINTPQKSYNSIIKKIKKMVLRVHHNSMTSLN